MLDTSVRWFSYNNKDSPVVINSWGDIISILDICLINGFPSQPISSTVVTDSTITLTYSSPHLYKQYQVLKLSGFDQTDMNTLFKIVSVTSTTVVIDKPSSISSGATLTGTLQSKIEALDWEKPFSAVNKGAYRSKDMTSNRKYLLVDDSLKVNQGFGDYNPDGAKWANVGIVEDLTDINTPTGMQAPYEAANPNANWKQTSADRFGWAKWYHSNEGSEYYTPYSLTTKRWIVVGDSKFFYLFIDGYGNQSGFRSVYSFGDPVDKTGDPFNTILSCHLYNSYSYWSSYASYHGACAIAQSNTPSIVTLRDVTGINNTSTYSRCVFSNPSTSTVAACGEAHSAHPNGFSKGIVFTPVQLYSNDNHWRGTLPGAQFFFQNLGLPDLTIFSSTNVNDDALLFINYGNPNNPSTILAFALTVKKAWR